MVDADREMERCCLVRPVSWRAFAGHRWLELRGAADDP